MDDQRGERAVLTPTIITVAETGSTNADLLAMAGAGDAGDGLWLAAGRQTAGRGRQGRDWSSPTGNLHASTLVRLRPGDPPAATLALVAAVALAETVHALGCPGAQIKWPNDLMLDGAKVAGILLERTGDWVVIGFGVNLVQAPNVPGRATAALAGRIEPVGGEEVNRPLAIAMRERVAGWRERGLAPVIARWLALAHAPGTPLVARLPDGAEVRGAFDGLGADGALILRLAGGGSRVIHAGDVFLV